MPAAASTPPLSAEPVPAPAPAPLAWILPRQAVASFASGAVLGPLCDGLHSKAGVLAYADPLRLALPAVGFQLETCW